MSNENLLSKLGNWTDKIRGRLIPNQKMSEISWFRVGGAVELFFQPKDIEDLQFFLKNLDAKIKVTVIGLGSNLLIRDGGLDGVVIKLSARGFGNIEMLNDYKIEVGAANPDVRVAKAAADAGIDGLTFYRGIPGGIGGALYMNAGCYGTETKDTMLSLSGVTRQGELITLDNKDMNYKYRKSNAPDGVIFTSAIYQGFAGDAQILKAQMQEITDKREGSQPVKSRTGGSTFKNPTGHSSWKLIDEAGCRGLRIGNAQVSELHCNFLLNLGDASAHDIELLGETVRNRVRENSGIELKWEIRRMGKFEPEKQIKEFLDGDVFTGKV
ncbi:MAG: UDP-N-acetylmuramate dehydrogenase [Devosiaceae bacterium]|nr:UDP-N-acetylmuramate dehydrogenase [Devosiaceae bacterium]